MEERRKSGTATEGRRTLDDDPGLVEADNGANGHALEEGEDPEDDQVERVPIAAMK